MSSYESETEEEVVQVVGEGISLEKSPDKDPNCDDKVVEVVGEGISLNKSPDMNPHDIVIEENRGINGNDSIAANNGKQQASNKKTWNDYKDVYGIFVCPKTYYQNFW
eukprot:CAMPEP_0206160474 /NCGR_PEP_ID=MMETSP1474-20131121/6802_1 /ASSEMBLY_ACC=CAM_ASM_001110 /TAXON_ID=97495 /ORGANISM="Imantonia sp., Strain RCC918" /LENGTH=107 /DNA_ID=CAMNT_0053561841 /DNA_START=49 /DNA_END=369 /DNA_ORIENTATION=-